MGGVFDRLVRSDGFSSAGGGDRGVREVEGDLDRGAQQPDFGVASVDGALDADDDGNMGMPVGLDQVIGRIEYGDDAVLMAVAVLVVAVDRPERRGAGRDVLGLWVQGRLVVLDLHDQGDVGDCAVFLGSVARQA